MNTDLVNTHFFNKNFFKGSFLIFLIIVSFVSSISLMRNHVRPFIESNIEVIEPIFSYEVSDDTFIRVASNGGYVNINKNPTYKSVTVKTENKTFTSYVDQDNIDENIKYKEVHYVDIANVGINIITLIFIASVTLFFAILLMLIALNMVFRSEDSKNDFYKSIVACVFSPFLLIFSLSILMLSESSMKLL